jgi:hypothetical protein
MTELKISMTVRAPFLTQSSAPIDYGLDAVLARDHDGRFYIPGTLIIGKLREAWQELASLKMPDFQQEINDWLGKKSDHEQEQEALDTVLPKRKRLYIDNLILSENTTENSVQQEQRNTSPHFRIRMDSERGVVEQGAYIVTERPFLAGEKVTFQGTARFLAKDEQEAQEQLLTPLKKGLRWINQLGANRTIGFGEVIQADVELVSVSSIPAQKLPTDQTRPSYDLCIRPQTPFCIGFRRIAGNLFQSSDVIPGGVIKGTIANMWLALMGSDKDKVPQVHHKLDKKRPELCRYFDVLRFTHAFPGTQQTRPVKPPLSLVKVGKHVYDVALCEGPVLIQDEAPTFAVDWKDSSDVQTPFGWPFLKQALRVRTAIKSEIRRADENQLFAYEVVIPDNEVAWYARLDLSDVPETDRPQVIQQLRSLLTPGVTGLGKTKAYTHIDLLPEPTIQAPKDHESQINPIEGVWIVTLQTPALLCNPYELNVAQKEQSHRAKNSFWKNWCKKTSKNDEVHEVNQADKLKQAYLNVWHQLSGDTLNLERFFASQSLAGGFYLWKRFQPAEAYQPYFLTDAGSVFVLRPQPGKEKEAQTCIEKWVKNGLPVPKWAITEYLLSEKPEEQWSSCPYIPQNGYGEIAVNLSAHWTKKPQAENFELIHLEEKA